MALSDLVAPQTRDAIKSRILYVFQLGNFPTANWSTFSLPRYLVETLSDTLADWSTLISDIAKGGYLDLCEGPWLTLLAKSLFNEDRNAAVFTRGTIRLTDAAGSGPHTLVAGAWWVATDGSTRRYKLLAANTIPLSGYVDVVFESEFAGAAWNVAPSTITQVVTPLGLGVTVSNPSGGTGTWITQQGTDEESDTELRLRCRDKWATLGSGSNEAAYRYNCTSSSPEITRVRVDSDPNLGTVNIVVAGPTGPVSSAALLAAQTSIEAKRPLTVLASVANANVNTINIAGVLYLLPGYTSTAVLDAAQNALDAYARTTDIGGMAYLSQIVRALQDVAGVRNVGTLSSPVGDVELGYNEVLALSYTLSTSL